MYSIQFGGSIWWECIMQLVRRSQMAGCWAAAGLCIDLDRGRPGDVIPKSVGHWFRLAASEKCGTPAYQSYNYHHIHNLAVGMLF